MSEPGLLEVALSEVLNPPCTLNFIPNFGGWAIGKGANGMFEGVVQAELAGINSLQTAQRYRA